MATASIAVLPFADLSPAKDQGYFCEGVANDLLNALGNAADLHCAPRSASFAFKDAQPDSRAIGKQLGVAAVAHGTLSRTGDHIELAAHLTDTADGHDLWARRYDIALPEILTTVDDVLAHIVITLKVQATPGRRFTVRLGTTADPRAYDLYLRGLGLFHDRYQARNCVLARDTLAESVAADPGFAKAWARLADCHSTYYMLFDSSTPEHWQNALKAAEKAIELAPELPLAHTAHGIALTLAKEFRRAEAAFEKAIGMNPRYFEAFYNYARMSFQEGNLKKAAALFEKASTVRPEDYQVPLLLRQVYLSLGRVDDAMRTARHGITIAQQHLALNPNDARALYLASGSLIQLGQYKQAIEWAERALKIDPKDGIINYNVACSYAQAGEYDKAMDCLEKAKHSGTVSLGWLKNDSDLVALHEQPRFQALIADLERSQR